MIHYRADLHDAAHHDPTYWGTGRRGLRPVVASNVGGGITLGWWRFQLWTTRQKTMDR